MNRNNFDKLLDKYLTHQCTDAERELVEQWYALLDSEELDSPKNTEALKETLWAKIHMHVKPVPKIIPFRQRPFFSYAAAASVAILIGVGFYLFSTKGANILNQGSSIANNTVLTQKNTSDKIISLTLEDGSEIDLSPNAELQYPKQFAQDKREVTLKGEAFFKIAKNPVRPFLVYAQGTITKVLGTSFTIQAFDDKMVTVQVKTGKVSVFKAASSTDKHNSTDPETQGVVLTPNQKAVINLKKEAIEKAIIEKPMILIPLPKNEDFTYEDAPIATIFESMEKLYGVDLIYDEELLKTCTLTTSLTDVPMFNKLKIICSAIGATYKEIDAQIVITAKGCH